MSTVREYVLAPPEILSDYGRWRTYAQEIIEEVRAHERWALDTETTGLDVFQEGFKLVGVVISPTNAKAHYIPVGHEPYPGAPSFQHPNVPHQWVRELLVQLLSNFPVVYHNAAYDQLVLARTLGLDLEFTQGDDTILIAHLLDENQPMSLKELSRRYLSVQEQKPTLSPQDIEHDLDKLLFQEEIIEATNVKGRTYKKKVRRLVHNWEELFGYFLLMYHDGALPYSFMMQLMSRFHTLLKKQGVVQFDGLWPGDFRQVPPSLAVYYASDDTMNTLGLFELFDRVHLDFEPGLRWLYEAIERPVNQVMLAATLRGIQVDPEHLTNMRETLERRAEEIHGDALRQAEDLIPAEQQADFDFDTLLSSPAQLGRLLFEVLGLPIAERTQTGNPSVGKTALKKVLDLTTRQVSMGRKELDAVKEFVRKKLEYQDVVKMLNTYTTSLLEKVDADGLVHPQYKVFGTVSGRMSSNHPNWQNMPRLTPEEVASRPWLYGIDVRAAFRADPDHVFVSADWSSMEMCVAAAVSGDEALKALLRDGKDLHAHTARIAFDVGHDLDDKEFKKQFKNERQDAKVVNFSQLYAGTWWTLHKSFGFPESKAKMLEQGFKKAYPGLAEWMEGVYEVLRRDGQIVYPEYGYIKRMDLPDKGLEFSDPRAYERQFQAALRTCLNAVIQGYSAWIAKDVLVKVDQELKAQGLRAQVMYQVHDDIGVMSHKDDAEQVQEILLRHMRRFVEDVFLDADPEIKITMSKAETPIPLDVLKGIRKEPLVPDLDPNGAEDEHIDSPIGFDMPAIDRIAQGVRRITL